MVVNYRLFLQIFFLFAPFFLTGCVQMQNNHPNPGTSENCTQRVIIASDRLAKEGIQIIRLGDDVRIIIPSDNIFVRGTPRLKRSYFPSLDAVIVLVNSYEKIAVKIAGYTDNLGSYERNLALSKQQTSNLMHYLSLNGLDTRILSAEGFGSGDPISSNNDAFGRAKNRRIEITFRYLPVVEE